MPPESGSATESAVAAPGNKQRGTCEGRLTLASVTATYRSSPVARNPSARTAPCSSTRHGHTRRPYTAACAARPGSVEHQGEPEPTHEWPGGRQLVSPDRLWSRRQRSVASDVRCVVAGAFPRQHPSRVPVNSVMRRLRPPRSR